MNFARARRARSPPLSWPTRLWTASPRNQKRPRRPLAQACDGGGFRTLLISSRRVREKSSSSASCAKYPMFRFFPRNTDPASASWRPIRTSRRVVFPAPFGPTRPTLSPFASSRSTSARRRRPPWDFATPSRRTTPGPEAPVRKERRKALGADGRVDLLEEALDRLDRVDVHVVRRLVEQEDVLLLRVREGARREDLGLLAAREGAEPLVEELLADAQVVQDRVVDDHALAAGGAPGDVQGFVTGHARARVRGVPGVRAGHPRLEAGELRLDPLRLRARGREDVPHDGLRRDVRDLREVAVPEPGLEDEVPQVRGRLAREEPEQGALPRAVRADEGDLVPRVEEEVGVLEDERGAPGFPEVPARDDRLHVLPANSWSPMRLRPVHGKARPRVRRSVHRP